MSVLPTNHSTRKIFCHYECGYSAKVNRARVIFAAFAVIGLAGCQYDPWAGKFLKRQPVEGDVVGWYAVDQASLHRTIKLPSGSRLTVDSSSHILLSADHTAEFLSVPEELDNGFSCSVTGRGTWSLGKNDSYFVIRVEISDEESNGRCRDTFTANYGEEINLYGESPPYRLHVTIGDPDSGDAVQFAR
ncbi:MAG TPA: hypothetical protein VHX60_05380 [Acidobacteriaceae bacterium]|jgi:hypothetical protein|nr:hypothetical protein [Acidobacteriaceae bacterium]